MHRHGFFFSSLLGCAAMMITVALADPSDVDLTPMNAAPAVALSDMAPMDMEFGQYHLTPFGVANAITASGARFTDASSHEQLNGGSFALAIDALRDWEHSYPRDPWVAKDLAKVAHTYARLHNADARDLAERTVAWLERDYPNSDAAKSARGELRLAFSDEQPQNVDASFANLDSAPPPAPASQIPDGAWQRYQDSRSGQ